MERFSFRSILLVLALVAQAAAGGNAFAGLLGIRSGVAVSQHCDSGGTSQHQAPVDRKHDCLSCPLCAVSAPSAPLFDSGPNVLILRASISLDAHPEFLAPPTPAIGRAHQPRVPPFLS
jgi:hypothetical protein